MGEQGKVETWRGRWEYGAEGGNMEGIKQQT